MEHGFLPVESGEVKGYFISREDVKKYADCLRQHRLCCDIGRSNTRIINRPTE